MFKKLQTNGFGLIEVAIIMLILAILAGIVVISVTGFMTLSNNESSIDEFPYKLQVWCIPLCDCSEPVYVRYYEIYEDGTLYIAGWWQAGEEHEDDWTLLPAGTYTIKPRKEGN